MVIRLATCVRERAINTKRSGGLRASLLALGLVGFVQCAPAANLLTNADFDQADGLSAWSWRQGGTGTLTPCSGVANCGIFSYAAADECCGRAPKGERQDGASHGGFTPIQRACSQNANTAHATMPIASASASPTSVPAA
jgi:hypothetical protein